ncbi:unnamed protein product [Anisakis simplex]|uniref:EGF-like domain-containing protein n=1 Tax=Anisakis simplex TaxID=6269 RepID=A0A0M3JRJ8_ANISI|nr:unnamed protein product [Anisakis simplex]
MVIIVQFIVHASRGCRNETEFDCGYDEGNVHKCIPIEWMCDNLVDCRLNARDESSCRYIHYCPRDTLACRNGECLDAIFKCNGFDDCGDGTDERGCTEFYLNGHISAPVRCPPNQFRCNRGPCITDYAKCDGMKDCPEGDDEENCGPTTNVTMSCSENQFMCDNSCLPLQWKCDGQKDCDDGTDEIEEECGLLHEEEDELLNLPTREEYHQISLRNSFCSPSEYLCEPGKCIPREKLCDNHKDCPNGDDEGHRCGECASYGCSYSCVDNPDGAQCLCAEGEELAGDGRTCTDVNECDTHAAEVCSHKCVNTHGSFRCECFDGFDLSSDARSCRAKPDPYSSILFSLGSEVRHMPLSSLGSTTSYGIYQHNDQMGTIVRSIVFARSSNQLLMAVSNADHEGHIHSSVNGLQKCLIGDVNGIANLAFDWIAQNIYYTSQHPSNATGVGVCSLNGRFCSLLVKGIVNNEYYRRQAYRGLVVNPLRGMMYWIDIPGSFDSPKIMTADMSGNNVRALVSTKLEHPQGLAMDYIKQRLYFADIELRLIERVDVNSLERVTITSRGVHHPYELAFFDDYIYWTDWSTEALVATRVNEQETPHVVHSLEQMPYGIAVNHSAYWNMTMRNPCEDIQCDHLCVLSVGVKGDVVGRCMCPNLYKNSEEYGCIPMNSTEIQQLGGARNVPSLCTTMMVEYCEKGIGCMNGGTCVKQINSHGHVEAISCNCVNGFNGQYCELGSAWTDDELEIDDSSFLSILFLLVLLILIAISAYLASEKCPVVRRGVDSLLAMRLVRLINPSEEDTERIIKPKSMVYESDGFSNPSYEVPEKDKIPLSSGAAPTYNTLPEHHNASLHRTPEPPRFSIDTP